MEFLGDHGFDLAEPAEKFVAAETEWWMQGRPDASQLRTGMQEGVDTSLVFPPMAVAVTYAAV